MLATLLESQHQRTRSVQAQAMSLGLHTLLIGGAVLATRTAVITTDPVIAEPVHFVRPAETPAPPPITSIPDLARLKGFRLLPTLVRIPDVLPDIDLSRNLLLTNPDEFLIARGQPGGDPHGFATADVGVMTVDQVDRAAYLLPGSGRPVFPEALRSAGLAGDVLVQFVIDTTGRADIRTLTIIASTNDRFTESVKRALEKARFAPAEFGGRRVRQIVRMPFVFSLER